MTTNDIREALRHSNQWFEPLFQGMPVGVVITGPDGQVKICNPAALALLGVTEDQLIGTTSFDPAWNTLHEDRSPFLGRDHPIPRVIASRQPVRNVVMGVYHIKIRDYVWFLINAEPQLAADGTVGHVVCCFTDITDRKRAEAVVTAWKNRYEAAISASGQVLYDWNTATEEAVWGGECERILGYPPEQLGAATRWLELVHPDDKSAFSHELDRVLITKDPFNLEYRVRSRSGRYLHVKDRGRFYFDEEAKVLRMVGFVGDITEQKEAEEELRQLSGRLLQSQDDERRRLARELHDSTAQSLAALGMNLEMVNAWAALLPEPTRKILKDSIELAEQCISELRTFSYLLHPPVLDHLGLSSAVAGYADGFAQRSGIKVTLDIASNLGRLPREVELMLFRIVQESLTNIHRHSGSRTATIRIARQTQEVLMEIKDHGHGISKSLTGAGGAPPAIGVGIASMRERVRFMGGRLQVRSRSTGTDVEVIVPIPPAATEPA